MSEGTSAPASIEPTGRLIIKNLSKNIDEKQLLETFKKHGEVTDCRIMRDKKTGESRRFAFIGFREVGAAVKAKQYFHNAYIGTGKISVDHAAKIGEYLDPKKQKLILKEQREAEKAAAAKASAEAPPTKDGQANERLAEYLDTMTHKKGRKVWADDAVHVGGDEPDDATEAGAESDTENVMVDAKTTALDNSIDDLAYLKQHVVQGWSSDEEDEGMDEVKAKTAAVGVHPMDEDVDDVDEEDVLDAPFQGPYGDVPYAEPAESQRVAAAEFEQDTLLDHGRVRIVNLPYTTTNESLSAFFSQSFGPVREVHICKDDSTNKSRGFGFVSFAFPEHAVRCLAEAENGLLFEGRIIKAHEAKTRSREFQTKLEETKGKSFKAKREAERRANAHKQVHTWNLLYVSSNAAVSAMADQLGIRKEDVMDLNATDLAVRAAVAETEVIKKTAEWLKTEGIRVNAFERKGDKVGAANEEIAEESRFASRSNSSIIAKHLPVNFDPNELKSMFSKFGVLAKFLVSPTKTIAIVQYCEDSQASRAFSGLAFRRLKSVPLYLEWAPEDLFVAEARAPVLGSEAAGLDAAGAAPTQGTDAMASTGAVAEEAESNVATLFVKNLAFSTMQASLTAAFEKAKGFVKATVAMKVAASGEKLSNGFGFVDFRNADFAKEALKKLQSLELDGKKLELSLAAGRRGEDQSGAKVVALMDSAELLKRASTRLSVKNIAFQATKEELRKLFATYGNVASVRLPQKVGERQHRGFAFVEFMTKEDALRAYESLQHTHLYGRRLIVEPAEVDSVSVDAVQAQTEKRKLMAEGAVTTESKRRRIRKDL